MKPFKTVAQREWGGLNEDENPSALGMGELSDVLNAAPYGTSLGTRPGISREGTGEDYDAAITGGEGVVGLHHFSNRTDFERDQLVAISDAKVWVTDTTGPAIDATTALNVASDAVNTFAQYRDTIYFCGYRTPPTLNSINYWNGNIGTNVFGVRINNIVGTQIPRPKYVLAKWGYLLTAGMGLVGSDNSGNPMCVRFNDLGVDPTLTASWPPANTIGTGAIVGSVGGIKEHGGEFITGLADFQDNQGDWLLIMTSHRIIAVIQDRFTATSNPFIVHSSIANGCVHQNAYVSLGLDYGDAIYMSTRGIHSVRQSQEFGGREDTFLSWKIRRLFDTLNWSRMPFTVGGYDQTEGYVLFAVSTGSNTRHDTLLCLDVRDKATLTSDSAKWYVWKLTGNERVNYLTESLDPNGRPRLYVGGTEGSVGYFHRNAYSDFGDAFSVSWTGKHEDYGLPGQEKAAGDMTVDVQPGGDYVPTLTTVFDFGRYQSPAHRLTMYGAGALWEDHTDAAGPTLWDQFDWASGDIVTSRKKLYDMGRGNTVASRFSHGGNDEPFFIAGLSRQVSGVTETIGIEGES